MIRSCIFTQLFFRILCTFTDIFCFFFRCFVFDRGGTLVINCNSQCCYSGQSNGIGNDSCHFVIHHIPFTSVFIFISIGCPEYSYLFSNLQILCSAHPSQENNIVRSLLHSQTPLPSHSLHIVRILIHDLFLYIKIVFPFQTSEL